VASRASIHCVNIQAFLTVLVRVMAT